MDPATQEIITGLPPELADALYAIAFDVIIIAIAVVALVTALKHVAAILHGAGRGCLDRPIVQIGLEAAPILLGVVLALLPGFLDAYPAGVQATFGVIAGYMSPGIYAQLKRRLPGVMLTKEARRGPND